MEHFGDDAVTGVMALWVLSEFYCWARAQRNAAELLGAFRKVILVSEALEKGYSHDAAGVREGIASAEWLCEQVRIVGMELLIMFLKDSVQRFRAVLGESCEN